MRKVTRDRVRDVMTVLHEWHKYVGQLEAQYDGPGFARIPNFSDEHPETLNEARELARDFAAFDIPAPHFSAWLEDPDDDIPDEMMKELGQIALQRKRRKGLSFDEAVKRKTSPAFREAIVAVRDALRHVEDRRARDEELPVLLDSLLDPSLTTIHGSTMEVTLRRITDVLSGARKDHPLVAAAADRIKSLTN